MNVNDFLENGIVTPNPNWSKSNAKKGVPKYLESYDVSGNKSLASSNLDKILPFTFSLDGGNNLETYSEHDVTINPINTQEELDKERARNQGAMEQLGHALTQTVVNEFAIGTLQAIANINQFEYDLITGRFWEDDYSFSNPVNDKLEEWKQNVKHKFDIYREDPNKTMLEGGLGEWSWYMENAPSIISSLTLLIPSAGATKILGYGLSKFGKVTGLSAKLAKAQRSGSNMAKAIRGFGVEGTTKNAIVKTASTAGFSRILENYQEAAQVYRDNKDLANQFFNSKDFNKEKFIKDNTKIDENGNEVFAYQDCLKDGVTQEVSREDEILNGEATGNFRLKTIRKPEDYDWDRIAEYVAGSAASKTFKGDLTNYFFDFIQVFALRNFVKGFKNKNSSYTLDNLKQELTQNWRKSADEIAANAKISNKLLRKGGNFLKAEGKTILAEASEGLEEGVNYIAQEYGNHHAKVLLGDAKDDFRISSYLNNGELWDSMFWGVVGGVVFQHAGSGFNKLSNKLWKNREITEIKSREDNMRHTMERLNSWISQSEAIDNGYDIYNVKDINGKTNDEKYNKFDEQYGSIEEQKLDAKKKLSNDIISNIALHAAIEGNSGILQSMLKDSNVKEQLKKTGVIQDMSDDEYIRFVDRKVGEVNDRYDNVLTLLDSHNVNPNYSVIIASNVVNDQINLDDVKNIQNDVKSEIAKHVSDNPNLISQTDLEEYRRGILKEKIIANLRKLREEHKKISKNKDVSSILRAKELQSQINALEKTITDDFDIIQYHSRRFLNGDVEEADKWMEEHIAEFTKNLPSDAVVNDEVSKEKRRILSGVEAHYGNLKAQDPALAEMLNSDAECEIAIRDLTHKTTLTKELITERVDALDKTFDNARAKVRKASEKVIDKMYNKYNANDVFDYINSKKDIENITPEDKEELDNAIASYDLLSDDDVTMLNVLKQKAEFTEFAKAHSEEERESDNSKPDDEPVRQFDDSSTGGTEETEENKVDETSESPEETAEPVDNLPFTPDNTSAKEEEIKAEVVEGDTEAEKIYSETIEKISDTELSDEQIVNNGLNDIKALFDAKKPSTMQEGFPIITEYMGRVSMNGMLAAEIQIKAKIALKEYLSANNKLNNINSQLGELAYDGIQSKKYADTAISLMKDYIDKTGQGQIINGRIYINLQAFIRWVKNNDKFEADRVLADEAYLGLGRFLIWQSELKGNAKKVVLLDNKNKLFDKDYINETNLTDTELKQKEYAKEPVSTDIANVHKSLDDEQKREFNKAIDSLNVGDSLEYEIEETPNGNKVLMLSSKGVKIAQVPIPSIDSDKKSSTHGSYIKVNDGWINDVAYVNGVPKSLFVDYLKQNLNPNSELFTLLLQYAGTDGQKETELKTQLYDKILANSTFRELKLKFGSRDNIEDARRINGLYKLISFAKDLSIDSINESYDNWADKIADTYSNISTFISGNKNGAVRIKYLHKGAVITTKEGNLPSEALHNYNDKDFKLAVSLENNNIIISGNNGYSGNFAYGRKRGTPFLSIMRENGEPSFVNVSPVGANEVTSTEGKEFVAACKNAFYYYINGFINSEDGKHYDNFNKICDFVEMLFPTKGYSNSPFRVNAVGTHLSNFSKAAPNTSVKNGWLSMDLGSHRLSLFVNSNKGGKATWFKWDNQFYELNRNNIQYVTNLVFDNLQFQVTDQYLYRDNFNEKIKDGIFEWDNGKLKINISIDGKTLFNKSYNSYSDFLIKNDMIKVHTTIKNDSNFDRSPESKLGPKMMVEFIDVPPVEKTPINMPKNGLTIPYIFRHKSSPTLKLLNSIFSRYKLKNIKSLHILDKNIIFVDENLGVEAKTIIKDSEINGVKYNAGDILIGKEFEQILSSNPGRAARILIHENLHRLLIDKNNRKILDNIKDIRQEFIDSLNNVKYISEFAKSIDKSEDFVKSWLQRFVSPYENNENANLEEFLVESLTNKDFITYLNIVEAETEYADEQKMSLWQKILKFIGKLFGYDIKEGSLREKEFYALADNFKDLNATPTEYQVQTEEAPQDKESEQDETSGTDQESDKESEQDEDTEDEQDEYVSTDDEYDNFFSNDSAIGEISDNKNIGTKSGYVATFEPDLQPKIDALFEQGSLQISCPMI